LLALIAALQTLHPACGRRAQTFLTQNGHPEFIDVATQTQILTGLVVIDVAQYLPQRFVLIWTTTSRSASPQSTVRWITCGACPLKRISS